MIETIDLKKIGVRGVNSLLHDLSSESKKNFEILNPNGQHSIACGVNAPLNLEIKGNVGFYCGGMNKHAKIVVYGHAGVGVGENNILVLGFLIPSLFRLYNQKLKNRPLRLVVGKRLNL